MPGYYEARAHLLPKIVSAIQRLVGQCRNAGIPIIYVQSVRTFREAEFTVFGREPHLGLGSWDAEIVKELKPQDRDTIIQKFFYDPFSKLSWTRRCRGWFPIPRSARLLSPAEAWPYAFITPCLAFI